MLELQLVLLNIIDRYHRNSHHRKHDEHAVKLPVKNPPRQALDFTLAASNLSLTDLSNLQHLSIFSAP